MKEGWEYKKLGEVCEIYQPQTIASNLLKKDGKYPVFGANGMIGRYDSYNHEEPEVLLCCRGATCGAINVSFPFSWINGNAMVVKPINDSYLKAFLRYLLLTLDYSHIITGAAQPQITRKSLSPVTVPVPPLLEQQRIVDYLDSAFAKIDAMKANAEKSLNEAKALFQAALKEMLKPKEGWTYKKLGDVFVSINNGANIKQIKGASGIPITRIETLSNDMFNRDRMGYANIDNVSPYTSYVLNDGDILMSHINSMKFLGRAVAYVKKDKETIIHGMNLLRLVPASDVLSPFMVYQFQTKFFRNQILLISHQSVNQASFNTTNLKGLNVIVPSLSEQQSIVATLDSLKSKVDRLQENCDKISQECDALKQAILRQVFE